MELFNLDPNLNICLSGGADGADLQWGMCAGHAGHSVIHWSFKGHKTQAPDIEVVRLTEDQLHEADPFLERANKLLKRKFPGKSWFVNSLLRRNYYQVQWAGSVYAVSSIKNGLVSGGTAWATTMYMNRFIEDGEPLENCFLYVFDQDQNKWFQWRQNWFEIDIPPKPSKIWAGIGSRDLDQNGKTAIRILLDYTQ